LSTENLVHLTVDNCLRDVVHFAKTFQAPWAASIPTTAADVPFVLISASYAGGQVAWIAEKMPGTYWAYLASSPLLEYTPNYWQYNLPQLEYGPPNCTADIARVIEYIDVVLQSNHSAGITQLKTLFGLEHIEHNDDFVHRLAFPVQSWAEHQFSSQRTRYEDFCDVLEGISNTSQSLPGPEGVGLTLALTRYAHYVRDNLAPVLCFRDEPCTSSYDAHNPTYTNTTIDSPFDNRPLEWLRCNEPLGGWVGGAPQGRLTLISRLLDAPYFYRQCSMRFPPGRNGKTFGYAKNDTVEAVNQRTGG
jgi:hypothetical protein